MPRHLPEPVRRRRPRAARPYGMTVTVDLLDADPSVWRRLALPSTLRLDELHDVLQAVFKWEDSHLYRFSLGDTPWGDEVEHVLSPYDVEEAGEGTAAGSVRLDEVLAAAGDELLYTYDYGDEWRHRLVVDQVGEVHEDVRLLDGRGAAPPEDSGGDPVGDFGPFDVDQAGVRLALLRRSVPPEIAQLLQRLAGTPSEPVLLDLLDAAELSEPMPVDETLAAETLRRYRWLLERVGDGLTLTAAGWLPPAVVTAAMEAVFADDSWIGKHNREDLTEPVRRLRASAQRLGLLRVARGRLTVTKAGLALREDPVGLWHHVAQRLAAPPKEAFERSAVALLMLSVAAGRIDLDALGGVLYAAGWQTRDGRPPTSAVLHHGVDEVLRSADAYAWARSGGLVVHDGGRALARTVLAVG